MNAAVVFDIGDVVCRFRPAERLRELASATGLDAQAIDDAIWGSGFDARADRGELQPDAVQGFLRGALQQRLDRDQLREAWSQAFLPDEQVCKLAERVRVPVYAFTNNGPMLTLCFQHELSEVASRFERIVCSWEVGACKPDPVAFQRLCTELYRPATDLLFVDDSTQNCDGARTAGLQAIHFRGAEELADELEARDLLGD